VTSLRLLAALSGAGALAAVATLVAGVGRPAAVERPAAAGATAVASAQAQAAPAVATDARAPAPELRHVPAGIISRAAAARALERAPGPTCRPAPRPGGDACTPQRDRVEIQWDVDRDR
jgi:hypothetical protein